MINFNLKDFVEKNIQDFNPKNSNDLIKAEKLLKAESKMNGTFSINEIDDFLDYLKNPSQNFDEILKIFVIKDIYNGNTPKNIDKKPDLSKINESEIEIFKETFTPQLKDFFSKTVRNFQWQTLINFHKFYENFVSVDAYEYLKNLIHDKNYLIIEGIENNDDLETILKNYPYCNDRKFYLLQSSIDSYEFDADILDINNTIARNQHTFINNKIILGEIILSLNYFIAENDVTRKIIVDNQEVAQSWTKVKKGFFSGIIYRIAKFFNPETQKKTLVFAISILLWTLFFSVIIYYSFVEYKIAISIIVSTVLLAIIGRNTPKNFYGSNKTTEPEKKIIQLTGSALIMIVERILWFIFVPSVLIYIYESIKIGEFPFPLVILAGVFIYKLYKSIKNK